MNDAKNIPPRGTQNSAPRPSGLPLRWATGTEMGPRSQNQDVGLCVQPSDARRATRGTLMIVCDGVGGEHGGQLAASIASRVMLDSFYGDGAMQPADALVTAIAKANAAVKAEADKRPEFKNMATTIVVALVKDDWLYMTNVGDSRGYLMRNGKLRQITKDHNFIAEQLASGAMTPEEAKKSTMKTYITRSLGASSNNRPGDVIAEALQAGDAIVMCTDGVHGAVSDAEMETLIKAASSPEEAARTITRRAVERKTADNATIAVMMVGSPASAPAAATSSAASGVTRTNAVAPTPAAAPARKFPVVAVLLGLVLLAALGGLGYMALTGRLGGGQVEPSATSAAPSAIAPSAAPVGLPTQPGANQGAPPAPTNTLLPGQPTPTLAPELPTPTHTPRPLPTRTFTAIPATATPEAQPTSAPPPPGGGGGGPQPTTPPEPTIPPPTAVPQPTAVPTKPCEPGQPGC